MVKLDDCYGSRGMYQFDIKRFIGIQSLTNGSYVVSVLNVLDIQLNSYYFQR